MKEKESRGKRKVKERREEKRGKEMERRVKRGTKKERNERRVCSVPQTDTSLLSAAQSNHMP